MVGRRRRIRLSGRAPARVRRRVLPLGAWWNDCTHALSPSELRALVAATRECAYLNTATYGPAPAPTVAAINGFTERWSRGAARFEEWEAAAEDCRRLFAALLSAPIDDIAIQPYVSTALGALASQLGKGERVVVSEIEFTSNLWPWLFQRRRGVEVAVVPAPGGRPSLDGYAEAVAGGCAILAVSAFQSGNGWRAPLRRLAEIAKAAGGMLIVDACQGAGAIALDPLRDGFDVLIADSYKWLMGPRGMGYMYISTEARRRFEPVGIGWRSGREPRNSYYGVEMDLSPTASRFDSSLSWISVVGDRESLRLLNGIGIGAIEAHDMHLAERFRAGLERIGIPGDGFPPPERSPSVAIALRDAESAVERLRSAGVVAARRGDMVRFSFHVFNDDSDVDLALDVLASEGGSHFAGGSAPR